MYKFVYGITCQHIEGWLVGLQTFQWLYLGEALSVHLHSLLKRHLNWTQRVCYGQMVNQYSGLPAQKLSCTLLSVLTSLHRCLLLTVADYLLVSSCHTCTQGFIVVCEGFIPCMFRLCMFPLVSKNATQCVSFSIDSSHVFVPRVLTMTLLWVSRMMFLSSLFLYSLLALTL